MNPPVPHRPPGIATIRDVLALERTPWRERGWAATTTEHLRRGAARGGGGDALIFLPAARRPGRAVRWSHARFLDEVLRAAAVFRRYGAGRGEVVSLVLPNLPETHFALWGAQVSGVANPVNPLLDPDQLRDLLRAAGATVVVTARAVPGLDLLGKVLAVAPGVPTLRAVLTVDPARHQGIARRALLGLWRRRPGARRPAARRDGQVVVASWERAMAEARPFAPASDGPARAADDVAILFATGGTTGAPKLAPLTHANLVTAVESAALNATLAPGEAMFCGLPLFHVNGVQVGGLLPLGLGATVILGPAQGFRAPGLVENFWDLVKRHRVVAMSGVPAVYRMILDRARPADGPTGLRTAICGAAPAPASLFAEFARRTGVELLEGYGMTEGACISTLNPSAGERRAGSVGLRLPYQEVHVGRLTAEGAYAGPCPTGETGALLLRGPNVFAGYLDPAHDARTRVDLGDGGPPWFNSGDLARLDADGYVWLTGRAKEVIIRGGHNLDPGAIERAFTDLPEVAAAAAVGRPDPRVGEVPVVYVTLKPGAVATPETLAARARGAITEPAAVPRAVRIVDGFTLTAIGKVHKPTLLARETGDVAREECRAAGLTDGVTVDVAADPARGLVVRVRVAGTAAPGQREDARTRLARYPFTTEFHGEEHPR